jgi:hypothetical protein
MKYPQKQFETLSETIKIFDKIGIDVNSIHPCSLHYQVFAQFSEGLQHNSLWIENGQLKRKHSLQDVEKAQKLVQIEANFELYPNDCNDNHIETAVKKAIKEL